MGGGKVFDNVGHWLSIPNITLIYLITPAPFNFFHMTKYNSE